VCGVCVSACPIACMIVIGLAVSQDVGLTDIIQIHVVSIDITIPLSVLTL
jgi:hypothetical protein